MRVRPFAEVDAAAVARLLGELGYPSTEEQVTARLDRLLVRDDVGFLVAELEGEVAGFAGFRVEPVAEDDAPSCRLLALVVGSRWRGRGVGRRLVEAVETEARRSGCGSIVLNSGDRRSDAHAFYERLGYASTGRRFVKRLGDPVVVTTRPFDLGAGQLSDDVVTLRLTDEPDLPALERAAAEPDIRARFRFDARPHLEGYRRAWRRGHAAAFSVCEAGRDDCAGQVLLELREAGRAEVGYWLLPERRGRGLATHALLLVARWALRQPQVARVQLWASAANEASQRVAERSGFRREGVLRSYGEGEGGRLDAVVFSLLPGDLRDDP